MDIRFYLTLLLHRLHYVVLFTLVGAALGGTIAMILPPRYEAKARLVVESQQIPDELAASTVRMGANEQLQITRQRILARETLLDLAEQFDIYGRSEGEPLSPDDVVTDMRSRITIATSGGQTRRNQPGDATLIDVSFSADSAALSATVANEIVTLILQENVDMRTAVTGETLDFFKREVERLDQALAERSAQITIFQEQNRDALPDSLDFRRSQLVSAQERLIDLDRELAQLRDRRGSLQALFERTGGLGAEAELSPEAQELRTLNDRYAANAVVLSDQNPRQETLRRQIERLEAVVSEQAAAAGGGAEEGETLTAFDLQVADIDDQIAFLEQRRARLEEQIETLTRTIEATPSNAIALDQMQRDMENIRRQYDQAVASRAQAETGDTIEALSKGQRISIIENATPPDAPNSPDRPKIAIAGVGGGLLAGLGLIALLELLNTSVRRGVEVERALDITPIATLSYMRTRAETVRRRALIVAAFAIAALGVPAGLWAVDTYYKPIDLVAQEVLDRLPDIPVVTDALQGVF